MSIHPLIILLLNDLLSGKQIILLIKMKYLKSLDYIPEDSKLIIVDILY